MTPRPLQPLPRTLRACAAGLILGGLSTVCMIPPPSPNQGNVMQVGPGRLIDQRVVTMREQKWQNVVRQRLDFSCGAAALATLLNYHYEDQVREGDIIEYMLVNGDQDRIKTEGFSLLDLQEYARARGYQTQGYRIPADVLERLANPAITLVTTRGYSHFVVLRGARDGYAYLADPSLGLRTLRMDEFENEWQGVVFFVAAQRNTTDPSALAMLGGNMGPTDQVRRLDSMGLRNIRVVSSREFRF